MEPIPTRAPQQGAALIKRATKDVGLDLHQASTVASVREASGRVIARSVVPTEGGALTAFLRGMRGAVHLTFEEGTQAQWLPDLLTPLVDRLVVCDRRGAPRQGNKGDQVDTDQLSELQPRRAAGRLSWEPSPRDAEGADSGLPQSGGRRDPRDAQPQGAVPGPRHRDPTSAVSSRRGGTRTRRTPQRAASWIRPSTARGSTGCIVADTGPAQWEPVGQALSPAAKPAPCSAAATRTLATTRALSTPRAVSYARGRHRANPSCGSTPPGWIDELPTAATCSTRSWKLQPSTKEETMKKMSNLFAAYVVVSMAGVQVVSAQSPLAPKPTPQHARLGYFVGKWTAEGEVKPGPMGPGGKMTSSDTCEWFDGRFSVICRSEGTTPAGPSKSLGIIGYSAEEKVYTYYGVDNTNMTMASVPRGTIQGDTWTYTDEGTMGGQKF
jgi:hypothetical protein